MNVLGMVWMMVWIQTLILKETWLFLTKQQFSQRSTYLSVVMVPGRVELHRSKHPQGTDMMKTSWRANRLCTDRSLYHSPGPKNTALVRVCCFGTKYEVMGINLSKFE